MREMTTILPVVLCTLDFVALQNRKGNFASFSSSRLLMTDVSIPPSFPSRFWGSVTFSAKVPPLESVGKEFEKGTPNFFRQRKKDGRAEQKKTPKCKRTSLLPPHFQFPLLFSSPRGTKGEEVVFLGMFRAYYAWKIKRCLYRRRQSIFLNGKIIFGGRFVVVIAWRSFWKETPASLPYTGSD